MTTMIKTKEDIEFHSDGFRLAKPAVNVKVYTSLANGFTQWKQDNPNEDARFTEEWIDENLSDDQQSDIFWSMCEIRWEDLNDEAISIWGDDYYTDRNQNRRHRVGVYSEGRSGGWAIVNGINDDVESWDAIELNKWKRFAKFARLTADGIMWDVVDSVYHNYFLAWKDEQSELAAPDYPEGLKA